MCALGVICIITAFPLYRYITNQIALTKKSNNLADNNDPIIQQSKADSITTRKDVQQSAKSLAYDLGTKYSDNGHWYDFLKPSGWTENDVKVADNLIRQRLNYKYLQLLYYNCYSNGRNLSDDILTLLDSDQLERVKKYIKL